ncbi:MAG: hypothetical protein BWZ10_03064 [candidate division BRC1 bacterium ADurb.BinA364]|nr:MAG: hypothetical protein BWZ10_03064 [candidate division BRC1 bacterium ADurb.BinA364]
MDGTRKPAWEVVRERFARYENDPRTCPWNETARVDVSAALSRGEGVKLTYASGVEFDSLRCVFSPEAVAAGGAVLRIECETPGDVLARIGGEDWLVTTERGRAPAARHALNMSAFAKAGQPLEVDLYFTAAVFPFEQTVKNVWLASE